MKLSFRWYGVGDSVQLSHIRQIPNMRSIVSAVYQVPPGEVWPEEAIAQMKQQIEENGLLFDIVESVPVHEDIKMGKPARDQYIENYIENIRRLSGYGVKVICYNFMPVFDWTRTSLEQPLADGSTALAYHQEKLKEMDPVHGQLSLPGWDVSYSKEDLKKILREYEDISEEQLWDNLEYFLRKIIPAAEKYDVKMAIHPDDPPWNIFGLPRIVKNEESLNRLLKLQDSPYNGLTFCVGSLGCADFNDVVALADKYSKMGRIHFLHFRNVKRFANGDFEESAHLSSCGSVDMVSVLKVLHKNKFDGYIRPDHGRMIWGETGRAGYGLFDRALGAAYINGIWEALEKEKGGEQYKE